MSNVLGRLGDRILEKLVPKTSAAAYEYYVHCYCRERSDFRKICMLSGGKTYCGSCYVFRTCGP
ncbi:hypothetical protein HTZ77_04050 [Nonomuraea sp. SMC257]|uniref:Uncharacterized protein n=1 Tax=Nonomuraea montanisoli TaxID=2741721 RepID=A0A7Y6I2Q0_9ACTN|nr:hypothetical protein [Nonomuraea montanisoli]NUW30597.1 hypothetical protein [Nonomuraea montanisoli]